MYRTWTAIKVGDVKVPRIFHDRRMSPINAEHHHDLLDILDNRRWPAFHRRHLTITDQMVARDDC